VRLAADFFPGPAALSRRCWRQAKVMEVIKRVSVQAGPGSSLKVIESEFLLQLLVTCSHIQRA